MQTLTLSPWILAKLSGLRTVIFVVATALTWLLGKSRLMLVNSSTPVSGVFSMLPLTTGRAPSFSGFWKHVIITHVSV